MAKVATTGFTISDVLYGEDVVAGDLVGWNGEQLVLACGESGNPIAAVGVAAASYKSGNLGALHLMCEVSGFSNLTPGVPQYLSTSTPGDIQAAVPAGSGKLKQLVGYAVASDRIAMVLQDAGQTLL